MGATILDTKMIFSSGSPLRQTAMQMTLQAISGLGTPPSALPKMNYLEILPGMDELLDLKGKSYFFCTVNVL